MVRARCVAAFGRRHAPVPAQRRGPADQPGHPGPGRALDHPVDQPVQQVAGQHGQHHDQRGRQDAGDDGVRRAGDRVVVGQLVELGAPGPGVVGAGRAGGQQLGRVHQRVSVPARCARPGRPAGRWPARRCGRSTARRARRRSPGGAGSGRVTGSPVVACCSAAHILRACSGSTRVSDVEHGEQHGRVLGAGTHVMVGRVGQQPAQLARVGGGAVLVVPGPAERELLVAHHVQQRRRADHGPVALRVLGQRRADQQPAVRAAHEGQLVRGRCRRCRRAPRRRRASRRRRSACGPGYRPGASCSPSSAPPRSDDHHVAAPGGDPGQRERGVAGAQADPEPAVAVDQRRAGPVRRRPG